MKQTFRILTPLLFFSLISCKHNPETVNNQIDSTLQITNAKGFKVEYFDKYKKVTVFNPWKDNTIYDCYYLVRNENDTTPADGKKIHIPLQTIALTSSTQLSFLKLLNEQNSIIGLAAPYLIYDANMRAKIVEKKITDLGDPFSLSIEQLHFIKPNALVVSGFNNDNTDKQLSGVPMIFNNEWMEETLLARAEWIKFMAAFYDKERLADSIFSAIENRYNAALNKVKNLDKKPTVLVGGNFRGTWYMPGGKSYVANVLKDAGANYFYEKDENTSSLPLNFEVVLKNFHQADYWIAAPANSLAELFQIDARHELFDAAKNKQVFNFNARLLPAGANDFWESGVTSPEQILEDMIWIFHPDLMPGYSPVFVKKLP